MWRSVVLCLAGGLCLLAQDAPSDVFSKPPAGVEEALRASLTKFFQAHVEKKFRQAEEVVAEESKDFYYNMEKQAYLSWETVRINYSDNFTKAVVVTAVEVEWRSPRIGVMKVKPPMTSMWKFENGKWVWWVNTKELSKTWDSPWGTMNAGPDSGSTIQARDFKGVSVEQIYAQVKVDKNDVRLSSYQPAEDTVELTSQLQGEVDLVLNVPPMDGLEMTLDKKVLKKGETATIRIKCNPKNALPKETLFAKVVVQPLNQIIPIRLTFAIPPELEKRLPKSAQATPQQ